MLLAGPTPTWIAPLATGHPLGLPGAQKQPTPQQRVQPVSQSGSSATSADREHPVILPERKDDPNPATHVAPPSIMQIKISQMLYEQASKQGETETPEINGEKEEPQAVDVAPTRDLEPAFQENAPAAQDTRDAEPKKAGETEPDTALAKEAVTAATAKSGYEQAGQLSETT